ncbi:MAG: T9SS type A sorting domain-containing protein [Armatimonadetes bacterium]|nr:T9SS type A sorting domain-containing protein [Armatimonadota bacterium]
MKRVTFFVVLIVLVGSLLADDLMQPAGPDKSLTSPRNASGFMYSSTRDRPAYEFIVDPTSIVSTYYDYMPGNYCSLPLRIQPEISNPYGLPAGGAYAIFMSIETVTAERRIFYAYIDADGNVTATDPVSTNDVRQGFPGLDVDCVTGNPFAAWHAVVEPDNSYDVLSSYDLYHMMGSPGLWIDEFISIDNPEAGEPTTGFDDDEFIWPSLFTSDSSPLGEDYRRVFVTGNNYTTSHGALSQPSENALLSYADFSTDDLNNQSTLDWNYRTIAQMDAWNAEDPIWMRPMKGCAVSDNLVAYAGYVVDYDATINDAFVLINENYGEGPFEFYSSDFIFPQWNPMNEDGTEYLFGEDSCYVVVQEIFEAGHMNIQFKDNNTKITWSGNMAITFDALDGNGPGYYYPTWCQIYPKEIVFDLNTHEFSFKDLYIEGADAYDNVPMVPWDLDEDGVVDSFDGDGWPEWVYNWPILYPADAFTYNNYKTVATGNWLVCVWADGTKAKRFYDGDNSFADWEAVPEIAIIISADHGATWSEPIFLNANDTPELAGQIPSYVYPGDVIEVISNTPGNYHGKIQLFYLDDNDFGSSINGNGLNNGGELMYASLDIEFPDAWVPTSTDDNEIPTLGFLAQNYPNPFNPSTTIKYEIKEAGNVTIEVFNIKGQKVKTLINEYHTANNYSTVWNGMNDNNESVSSGIYFYKMKTGDYNSVKKMILMK